MSFSRAATAAKHIDGRGSPQPEASTSAVPAGTATSSGLTSSSRRTGRSPRRSTSTLLSDSLIDADDGDETGATAGFGGAYDDLGLSSDDEVESVLPVYLSQTHGANLHLFQYPVTERIEVPDAAAELGGKINARWKAGVRRFELEIPLDTRPEIYDRERGAEFGEGAKLQSEKEAALLAAAQAAAAGGANKKAKKERTAADSLGQQMAMLKNLKLRSEVVPGQTVYMAGSVRSDALYLHPLALQMQLRPSLDYLTALDERSKEERRRERAGEGDEDSDDEKKEDAGKAVAVSVKRPPGDGPARVSNTNIQILRTESEEQWVKMAWHEIGSEHSREIRDAIFSGPAEVLESTTKGADLLESKPVGPSARWA